MRFMQRTTRNCVFLKMTAANIKFRLVFMSYDFRRLTEYFTGLVMELLAFHATVTSRLSTKEETGVLHFKARCYNPSDRVRVYKLSNQFNCGKHLLDCCQNMPVVVGRLHA